MLQSDSDETNQERASPAPAAFDPVEPDLLTRKVLWLQCHILGVTLGIMLSLGLFVATLWLVLKGGEDVGAHLGLLRHYFPGYTVTLPGSFLGAFYGFLGGYLFGVGVALIYNGVSRLRILKHR